jgi:heme A synthase
MTTAVLPRQSPAETTKARSDAETRQAWRFFWLSVATIAATYLLIVVGATVRVTGSGLGCPDWPTCYGRLIPPPDPAAIIEYTHRLLGAIVSPLILALPAMALYWRLGRRIVVPALIIPVLLALQIVLGAIVVRLELPPMVVLVHLGFAMLILGGLVWVAIQSVPLSPAKIAAAAGAGYFRLLAATAMIVFVLVLSGAFTRATGASWACAGFPGCEVPAMAPEAAGSITIQGLVHIHLLHRTLAYFVAALAVAIAVATWRRRDLHPALGAAALLFIVSVIAQFLIGIGAVSLGLPTLLRGAHVAGAAAVWASSVLLLALGQRARMVPPTSATQRMESHLAPAGVR